MHFKDNIKLGKFTYKFWFDGYLLLKKLKYFVMLSRVRSTQSKHLVTLANVWKIINLWLFFLVCEILRQRTAKKCCHRSWFFAAKFWYTSFRSVWQTEIVLSKFRSTLFKGLQGCWSQSHQGLICSKNPDLTFPYI